VDGLRFRGVLFDFDNTLVDSAAVLPKAQQKVAELIATYIGKPQLSMEIFKVLKRAEEVLELHGVYDRDRYWQHVLAELGFGDAVDERLLREWTRAYWEEYMKHELFPDALHVLGTLRKVCKLAIVTNTDGLPGMKRQRLEKAGVLDFFEVVVIAGEGGVEAKPSPQPFRLAVKMLGLSPSECLMVGDDPVKDVAGAKAAGIYAALFDRFGRRLVSGRPDYIISRLMDVLVIVFGKHF
jgi:putative hydrolase of the HAD superfamily